MRTASESSYDPAPLQWVSGEIEHSLVKARESFDIISANPGDSNAIQSVAADLHQVKGALLMVGLDAAARLTEEAEKLVETFKGGVPADVAKHALIAKQSTVSLSKYLEGLVAGNADRPMELAAPYVMLNKARGASDASASDLFAPDLSAAATELGDEGEQPPEDTSVEAVSRCRGIFQAGLLKLVRDKDLAGGALHMCDAILALEALDATSASRTFWFTAVGFLEAVANDPAGAGTLAVQLFGKIDQQIKRLMEGNHHVPEKLFRDLLLIIGRSAARTERIERIREIYRLDDLLSLPGNHTQNKNVKKLIPVIEALRGQIRGMKDELQLFTGNNFSALAPLTKHAAALATIGQQLPNGEMVRLLQLLGAVGRHLNKTGRPPSEVQALEVATALLFVESSLEDFFRLEADFDQQAAATCTRIQSVMTGVVLPGFNRSVASLSDTMTLQAQTHLLVFQVGREVRANLAMIEGILDDFFRDASKVEGLASVENLFKQVRGAFSILEDNEAAALAVSLAESVARFAAGTVKGEGDEARKVAEGVSALGLYVEGLQQGSPDARAVLLPALISCGIATKPEPDIKARSKAPVAKAVAEVAKAPAEPPREEAVARKPDVVPVRPPEPVVSPAPAATPASQAPAAVSAAIELPIVPAEEPAPEVAAPAAEPAVASGGVENEVENEVESELERLMRSETELKAVLAERDQRIRALQMQMVALHKEVKTVDTLKAELKELRAALANAQKKSS